MSTRPTVLTFCNSNMSPYSKTKPAVTNGLIQARQEWKLLCSTPLADITADKTLRTLIQSAELSQQNEAGVGQKISTVLLYALVFDTAGKKVLMLHEHAANGDDIWSVPHKGLILESASSSDGSKDGLGKEKIKDAVKVVLFGAYGILCDEGSVYVVKAMVPIRDGGAVATVVRVNFDPNQALMGVHGNATPVWVGKNNLARIGGNEVWPDGMKGYIEEALEQAAFEKDVVVE